MSGHRVHCGQVPLLTVHWDQFLSPALPSVKFGALGDEEEVVSTVSAWGCLSLGPVFQLIQGEEEPPTPKPKIELPQWFHIRPVTPVEKYIKVRKFPLNIYFHK